MTSYAMIMLELLLLRTMCSSFAHADSVKSIGLTRRPTRGCPMSPYAIFLTEEQQETLHELVVEARREGADESTVKEHIDKYISKVLPPKKYAEFQEAFETFEANRRGKRSAKAMKNPRKVNDLIDQYPGKIAINSKFYKDRIKKLRHF